MVRVMAETKEITVTKDWTLLGEGVCLVQTTRLGVVYEIAYSDAAPTADASIKENLDITVKLGATESSLWAKLQDEHPRDSEVATVITGAE